MTIEMVGGRVTVQGKKAKAASGETSGKRGKRTATPATATESAATSEVTPVPAAAAPSRRRKKTADSPTTEATPTEPAALNATTPGHDAALPAEPPESTLTDLAAGYLAHLEASGKSQGTVFSYRLELAVAMDEIGKDTPVRELTAERVEAFFESERVTRTRSGRSKSPLSIAKTTRVLRQALAWGVERGIVEAGVAPVR